MRHSIILLALCGLSTTRLIADTVYTTFGPGDRFLNGALWMVGGPMKEEIAASFAPAQDFTLAAIDFAAVFLFGSDNHIKVDIASGASAPGPSLESFDVNSLPANPAVLTVTSGSHPHLSAGVTYWVVLSAPDAANTLIGWNQNDQGVVGLSSRQDGGAWSALGTEVTTPAFDVLGSPISATIPEPSTGSFLALLLVFQITAVAFRRRKGGMVN